MENEEKKPISIRFPTDLTQNIKKEAEKEKRTFSSMVLKILYDYFKKKKK